MENIVIENYVKQVAALLGADETDIPEETLNLPIYKGAALAWVSTKAKKYDTLDTVGKQTYKLAVVYKTALLMIPWMQMQRVKVEQTPDAKYERFETDWNAIAEYLNGMLEGYLAEIKEEEQVSGGMSTFGVTNRERSVSYAPYCSCGF